MTGDVDALAATIRQRRLDQHLSLRDAAAEIGTGATTLASWELGVKLAEHEQFVRYLELLGLELHDPERIRARVRAAYERGKAEGHVSP